MWVSSSIFSFYFIQVESYNMWSFMTSFYYLALMFSSFIPHCGWVFNFLLLSSNIWYYWYKRGDSGDKEYACQWRDMGSIPGSGRCPGVGNGNPLQYSCLENSRDREAWWVPVHGAAKSQTWLKQLSMHACADICNLLWNTTKNWDRSIGWREG